MAKDERDLKAAEGSEQASVAEESRPNTAAPDGQLGEAPTFGLDSAPAMKSDQPKKKISGLTRSLLMFVGLLAVAALAWGAVSILAPAPEPSQGAAATIQLYAHEEKDIVNILVENHAGTFEYYPVVNASGTLDWSIRGYDIDNLSRSKMLDISDIGKKLMATELIKANPTNEDLTAYGLVTPMATVTITLKEGQPVIFDVGATRPDGEGAYCLMRSTNEIYAIWQSTQTYILREPADYWDFPDITMATAELRYLKIMKEGVTTLEVEDVTGGVGVREGGLNIFNNWVMHVPYQHDINVQRLDEWYGLISSHQLDYLIEADAKDLAQYGLAEPALEIEYRMADDNGGNKRSVNIKIGAMLPDGKSALCIVDDVPDVYSIAANTFDYVDVNPLDLVDRNILVVYMDTVNDVSFTGPEGSFTIKVERDMKVDANNKPVIDESTGKQAFDEYHYLNGKQADELSVTRKLYEHIISLQILGLDASDVTGQTPLYEIVYNRNTDERKQIRIGFYPYEKDYLSVTIDGKQLPFYASRQQVEELYTRRYQEAMAKIEAQ